ncbi:MAG: ribbon-helix-helix protein, CopG family [Methylomicrobium sp.]|nr:ribbon-helix-helix protein, CopG family [Methylomicrobium sp.]
MRITARIDEDYEQKLKAIQRKTNLNTTEIIKIALDLLYEKTELSAKEKNRMLIDKLAGIGHGPRDGSVRYKEYVAEYIDEKLGYR